MAFCPAMNVLADSDSCCFLEFSVPHPAVETNIIAAKEVITPAAIALGLIMPRAAISSDLFGNQYILVATMGFSWRCINVAPAFDYGQFTRLWDTEPLLPARWPVNHEFRSLRLGDLQSKKEGLLV